MMTKTINLGNGKRAFGFIDAEAIGGQHIKHLFEVKEVICTIFAEN
jgi:hypothetical protein